MELKPIIVNYGVKVNPSDLPKDIVQENERLRAVALDTMKRMNFQNTKNGAVIVSEVLHTGIPTENNWEYMSRGLSDAARTFYFPNFTPFLLNHNNGSQKTGQQDIVGKGVNIHAEYISRNTEHPKGIATGYIKVATFIPEHSTHDRVKVIDLIGSRQIMHLSAGAVTKPDDNVCSICSKGYFAEDHTHKAGKVYKGQMCIRQMYNPRFREYSAVPGNPGDIGATLREMSVIQDSLYGAPAEDFSGYDFIVSSDMASSLVVYDTGKIYSLGGIRTDDSTLQTEKEKDMELKEILDLIKANTDQVSTMVGLVKTTVDSFGTVAATLTEKLASIGTVPVVDTAPTTPATQTTTEPVVTKDEATEKKIADLEATMAAMGETLKTVNDGLSALMAKVGGEPSTTTTEPSATTTVVPPAGGAPAKRTVTIAQALG